MNLKLGDRVRIIHEMRPGYGGKTGTVVGFCSLNLPREQLVNVRLDNGGEILVAGVLLYRFEKLRASKLIDKFKEILLS